ncbi:peptidoglycan editing factor PgeF [Vibrio sp. WXL210]|uniref:peptidoglycan editing factor PgeF n=1 Tax=Vibrio sp. WXL210 TaxID=3450709 RepID=UPI003EC609DC
MMIIVPNWPAPANIKAISSLRKGGASLAPYDSLNVGMHVGDINSTVELNRQRLVFAAQMPSNPVWLNQTHSNYVHELVQPTAEVIDADATFTNVQGVVCAAMTADCLPVLLTDKAGTQVAAVHAGWRGLANGIVDNALAKFAVESPSDIIAWLGPAIGPDAFEVGQDVFDAFVGQNSQAQAAFKPSSVESGKYFANMHLLATIVLNRFGVDEVYRSELCTHAEKESLFSYRRDGVTGRQVTCIWIEA